MVSLEKSFIKHLQSALIYEETESFYHNLDPRIKLLYLAVVFVMISTRSIIKLLTTLVFIYVLASLYPRIYKRALYILIGLAPLMIFTMVFIILFTVVFGEGTLGEAVLEQIKVFVRTTIVAAAITTVASSTTPREFVHALVKLGFKYTYLYTLIIAVRFIPIVLGELSDIYDAQRSRGLELEKGGIKEKLKKLNAILIPAFVCSLLRARDLVEALELRGFGYSSKRTFYRNLKFKKIDGVFTVIILLSVLVIHLLVP